MSAERDVLRIVDRNGVNVSLTTSPRTDDVLLMVGLDDPIRITLVNLGPEHVQEIYELLRDHLRRINAQHVNADE